jgi:hypothetical protein
VSATPGACPAPDVMAGMDQCEHGTWPCAQTEAAWHASGTSRAAELAGLTQACAREARFADAGRQAQADYDAARRAGRLPQWEAELEAGG